MMKRTYKEWKELGYVVKKGEHSLEVDDTHKSEYLFDESQVTPIMKELNSFNKQTVSKNKYKKINERVYLKCNSDYKNLDNIESDEILYIDTNLKSRESMILNSGLVAYARFHSVVYNIFNRKSSNCIDIYIKQSEYSSLNFYNEEGIKLLEDLNYLYSVFDKKDSVSKESMSQTVYSYGTGTRLTRKEIKARKDIKLNDVKKLAKDRGYIFVSELEDNLVKFEKDKVYLTVNYDCNWFELSYKLEAGKTLTSDCFSGFSMNNEYFKCVESKFIEELNRYRKAI